MVNSSISVDNVNKQLVINDSIIDMAVNDTKVNDGIIDIAAKEAKEVKMNEVIVPNGKRTELLLADGTKIWLNAGSCLAFPSEFSQDTREIYLKGEACFRVAKNKNKPFMRNAGQR